MDVIQANKVTVEQQGIVEKDPLHCTDADCAKLQAKAESKLGEGEIMASKTVEYAQIGLHSKGSNGGDVKGEETVPDTQSGQQKDTNGLIGQVSDKVMA